jgi:putative effector of murein hydrolase LrgA (UPF0299 family)
MIAGFTLLLLCQLAGEVAVRVLGLPIPGPVVGMVVLVGVLAATRRRSGGAGLADPDGSLGRVCDGLLGALGLLFVPAGVGVIQYLGLIGENGVAIAVSLVVSTLLALVATVGTYRLIRKHLGGDREAAR